MQKSLVTLPPTSFLSFKQFLEPKYKILKIYFFPRGDGSSLRVRVASGEIPPFLNEPFPIIPMKYNTTRDLVSCITDGSCSIQSIGLVISKLWIYETLFIFICYISSPRDLTSHCFRWTFMTLSWGLPCEPLAGQVIWPASSSCSRPGPSSITRTARAGQR